MTQTFGPAILSKATSSLEPSLISLVTGNGRPRLVAGLAKLVQQVTFLLLTDIDSIEGMPGVGSSPIAELMTTAATGEQDAVNGILAESVTLLTRQLASLRSPFADPSEMLGILELSVADYDRDTSSLTISVHIESAAGETAEYEITR